VNFAKAIWLWLGDSKEQIVSISALIGVTVAVSGLRTWRKELKGKSEYQKAKDVLKAVYNVRPGFVRVRLPWMDGSEYPKALLDQDGNVMPGRRPDAIMYAYQMRMKVLGEAFKDLEQQTMEAQVEWGSDFQNLIIPLRQCWAELGTAVQQHLEMERSGPDHLAPEERREVRAKLYYAGDNDSFTMKIEKAISGFEERLRPHINPPSLFQKCWRHRLAVALRQRIANDLAKYNGGPLP